MAILTASVSGMIGGLLSILFGVLVLVFPKFLRYFVGIYFLAMGILAMLLAF